MNPLLILPEKPTADDAVVWRVAINRRWNTERVRRGDLSCLVGRDQVRYYGNVLHASQIADRLPLIFTPISTSFLAEAARDGYTGRAVERMAFRDLTQPMLRPTFVKATGVKWLEARIYQAGETIAGPLPDDEIYVQPPVRFSAEVRCFVRDGRVETASYYRRDGQFTPQWFGETAPLVFGEMVERITTAYRLPAGVVLDFGMIDDRWVLIEANEAWASGLYDCDPERAFDVIVASQQGLPLVAI